MNKQKIEIHSGGCLCGIVRYEAKGAPVIVAHCHCEDCQRYSGAGHSTVAIFATANFQLKGQISEYTLKAENGNQVTRAFCPICGSSILSHNDITVEHVAVSLGTLDDASTFEPQIAIFDRNKKSWDVMDEALKTYNSQPDWKPDNNI